MQPLRPLAWLQFDDRRNVKMITGAVRQQNAIAYRHYEGIQGEFAAGNRLGDQVVDASGLEPGKLGGAEFDAAEIGIEIGVDPIDRVTVCEFANHRITDLAKAGHDIVYRSIAIKDCL